MNQSVTLFLVICFIALLGCTSQSSASGDKKPSAEGMTQLPSGLKYREIKAGTGESPGSTDEVEVHYRGQFEDAKEFDSSYKRGKPAVFRVDGVIKGWTEALQKMKEGAKWELCIPPELAYGKGGMPPVIPPNATLYFEVELLKIRK